MKLSHQKINTFRKLIFTYYKKHGRSFPWRSEPTPYNVFISEVMLQQTQANRVIEKFNLWIQIFPDWDALAHANLKKVLEIWQGLGYNRRAKALRDNAQKIIREFNGALPSDPTQLQTLLWIGPNTASSICAFAFNQPTIFIETNIRTVFIHHFFKNDTIISDSDLLPLIEQTLPQNKSRIWYSALMDYGTHLKQMHGNPSRKSKHHSKQSKFEGSDRQIRGQILKLLIIKSHTCEEIQQKIKDNRIEKIIHQLIADQLIEQKAGYITLTQ